MSAESFATRLYRGEVSWDFIGRRRIWYAFSGLIMLIGIISLIVRGLNPSIDFKGGAEFEGPLNGHSISQVKAMVSSAGIDPQQSQTTGSGSSTRFQIQTETLTEAQVSAVTTKLTEGLHVSPNGNALSISTVGSTWGGQITNKAIEGLVIFLIAVVIYLTVRFEWKMAMAAIIALLHDLLITAGIYSLSGLEVSPSTVIALLTILGYSLYDTVVVFDKVRENTAGITGGSRMTYTQAANLAVNQTLVRSINTSIIALLPVIGLLVIGVGFLGAGSLEDLSLALLVGLASGAYSSIFIATPLLAEFKERESTYQQLAVRVANRRSSDRTTSPATPAVAGATAAIGVPASRPAAADDQDDDIDVDETSGVESPLPVPGRAVEGRIPASQRRKATGNRPGGRGTRSKRRR